MKNFRIYFAVVALYWLFLAVMLLVYGYRDSFLLLNGLHSPALDYIMYVLTWLGDSLFISSLIVIVFPRKTAMLLMVICTVTVTGLLAQALKQWFFSGWDRPLKVFEDGALVHIVGDYRLFHRSFPSGHAVTTGTVFTVLAWYLRESRCRILALAALAVIVSYTRIYTGAHFAGDVLAGSAGGTFISFALLKLIDGKVKRWVDHWPRKAEFRFRFVLQIAATAGLILAVIRYLDYILK